MKNSNDTIGNRTRDLPSCSAVPQPTAPPRAPGNPPVVPTIKLFTLRVRKSHCNVHENPQVSSISCHKPSTESIFLCPTAHHKADNITVE